MVEEPPKEPRAAAASVAAAAVDPERVLAAAQALIGAPSENPGGTEDEVAAVAEAFLTDLGADTTVVRSDAGRPSVVGTIGDGARPHLAWNGHLDVVPAGSLDTWSHDPWAGEVDHGRLYGRGSADMKGPVAAALEAAAAVLRSGIDVRGTLVFHLAADEELAGVHGTKVLWERGFLDQDACIVGEPSELQLGLAERGGAWFTAIARGKSAHGSQPHRGVNAITTMSRFLLRLHEVVPDVEHPLTGRPTVNAAIISGGSAPNVVPDRCEVDIDRRISPGETDREQIRAPFLALVQDLQREHPEVDIDIQLREWTDAAEASPDTEIVRQAIAALSAETEAAPALVGFTGITDARFYINEAKIPTVIMGPGSLTVAHTADESIEIAELVTGARAYARIFATFLGG